MQEAIILMGGLGLFVGICLAAASKIFYVYVDPKILAVEDLLPGANCGGCGLPGCSANAAAIVEGKAAPNSCVAGGQELAEAIAALLGVAVVATEPDIARPGCHYGVEKADTRYHYDGLSDCRAVALLGGGMKVCTIGCVGLGTCATVCPFGAITMGPHGLPVVDEKRCTGCGTCERVCPKHIITLSSVTRRILREYTVAECTTPCQRACPAGIDIRRYIGHIARGNTHLAVQVIKERNPFPAVIGRICPRPCEDACRRQYVDVPVAINDLKRYAADAQKESGMPSLPYKAPETGRRIAVAGGGVAGLSAAFFSARLGHGVTVFEARRVFGGLLRAAITANRLPADVLDDDIRGIADMGVVMAPGKMMGREVTVAGLLADGYDAVYVSTGGWDSRMTWQAADPVSPLPALGLVMDVFRAARHSDVYLAGGRDVVVAAVSGLSLDAVEMLRSSGAEQVTVVYRRSADALGITEKQVADAAGATVLFEAGVDRIVGEGDRLLAVEILDLTTRAVHRVRADGLLFEAGRLPELICVGRGGDQETDGDTAGERPENKPVCWTAEAPYKRPDQFASQGFLADGDPITDFSAAIKAIGAGRRAAVSIHQLMNGERPGLPDTVVRQESQVQNVSTVEGVLPVARQVMPLAAGHAAMEGRLIEKGFSASAAQAEAGRCLQCGLICYAHTQEEAPLAPDVVEETA